MLEGMLKDKIKLRKADGTEIDGISASVQSDKIFINDEKIIIDEGDILLRKLPNGKEENYEVINPEFFSDFHGIPAHYEIKVRKTTLKPKTSAIIIQANNNAHVNVNSVDNSVNNSFNNNLDIFDKLKSIAETLQDNTEILKSILEMKCSVNDKKTFKEKYNNFIQAVAAHMTLFTPLITELIKFL